MQLKCFDIAEMVIDEATKQFFPIWIVNEEKKETFKQYCEALDSISDEFYGEAFDVDVDDAKMAISIKLFCSEFTIEDKSHPFYALAKKSLSMSFAYEKEDRNMSVEFVFPSIWDKAY
jgi:hypothetical protein